jgi:hypothetical protein
MLLNVIVSESAAITLHFHFTFPFFSICCEDYSAIEAVPGILLTICS